MAIDTPKVYLKESHQSLPRYLSSDNDPLFLFHLQKKLNQFQEYYNERRVHSSLGFKTPKEKAAEPITNRTVVSLENYRWESHCKGLYQLPVAA